MRAILPKRPVTREVVTKMRRSATPMQPWRTTRAASHPHGLGVTCLSPNLPPVHVSTAKSSQLAVQGASLDTKTPRLQALILGPGVIRSKRNHFGSRQAPGRFGGFSGRPKSRRRDDPERTDAAVACKDLSGKAAGITSYECVKLFDQRRRCLYSRTDSLPITAVLGTTRTAS